MKQYYMHLAQLRTAVCAKKTAHECMFSGFHGGCYMTVIKVFVLIGDVSQERVNVDTTVSLLEYYNDVLSLLVNNVWKCFTYTSQCSPAMDRKKHSLAASEITDFNKMYDDPNTDIHCVEKQISFSVLKQNQSFSSAFNSLHTNIFLGK